MCLNNISSKRKLRKPLICYGLGEKLSRNKYKSPFLDYLFSIGETIEDNKNCEITVSISGCGYLKYKTGFHRLTNKNMAISMLKYGDSKSVIVEFEIPKGEEVVFGSDGSGLFRWQASVRPGFRKGWINNKIAKCVVARKMKAIRLVTT